ncbi:hypothetical protein [Amycolatopsis kentuckyensis]|uniref:hypothetical protein n=1 Tax=Amycolatopsis kentuckyensis TaxID=218823 RepID=UPI0035674A98
MAEQPTTPEVTEDELSDMRATLADRYPGAVNAPKASVLNKIEKTWRGGVAGYLRDNYDK